MFKVVVLQILATLAAAGIGGIFSGQGGIFSALLGGLSYLLPNLVFVVRLKAASFSGRASSITFLVGEFGKVVATIGILVAVQQWYVDVQWLFLLIGLFAALKANLFAFLVKT